MGDFRTRFLGWDRPALHTAAEHLLADAPDGPEVDLSGEIVVVPGERAGRRLQELLIDGAETRGRPLRPGRVVTVGALPELLYRPERPPPPGLAARLAWARALGSLRTADVHLLMARPPGRDDLPGWVSIARLVERVQSELAAELLSFGEVAQACARGRLLFDDRVRWELLARAEQRVTAALAARGWEARDAARRRALDEGRVGLPGREGTPTHIRLVAVAEMPRVVREMLAALPRPVDVLVHAPATLAEAFHPDGTLRLDAWRDVGPDAAGVVAGGPADQAERVVRALAGLEPAPAPDEVTVGVADPEVGPFLEQRLDFHDVPFRVGAGRPFPSTGPYLLLAALARLAEEDTAEAFAAAMRHPDLEAWLGRAAAGSAAGAGASLAALDRWRASALPMRMGGTPLPRGWAAGDRNEVQRMRDRVGELLGPLRRSRPLGEWGEAVTDLLARVYGERPLSPERPGDREVEAFAARLRAVLEEAAGAGDDEVLGGGAALRLLLGEMETDAVPPPGEDAAVEVLGWLELLLDDAPHLVVTGVNAPFLPEARVADPFLPDALREALGLAGSDARRARDAYRLSAILASRPGTLLVSGRRTARGEPLAPSPLLLTGSAEEIADAVRRHYGEKGGDAADPAEPGDAAEPDEPAVQPGTGPRDAGPSPAFAAAPSLLPPPEPELPAPDLPLRVRVTDFRTLLADPYLWLLSRRVRSDAWVDDALRELDPAGFGSLAHQVLEALGRELGDLRSERELASGLADVLDREARVRFGARPLPSVRIQLAQLRTRLAALAAAEARERAAGWEIVAVEAAAPREGVPFEVDPGRESVFLTGRVDRVDRHPELGWRLLDYKTSESAASPDARHRRGRGDGRAWVDLQLPLYRHLAPRLEDAAGEPLPERPSPSEPVGLGYVNLPRDLAQVGHAAAEWSTEELAHADETARAALRPLLSGASVRFGAGEIRVHRDSALAPMLGVGILGMGPLGPASDEADPDRTDAEDPDA